MNPDTARRRAPRAGSRLALRGLLPIIVALAIVAVLTAAAPDADTVPRRWTSLRIGETGAIRDLAVTVTGVESAAAINVHDSPLRSTGTFVVVHVEATALVDPVVFNRVRVRVRGGERYKPRPEWSLAQPPLTQPGFTSTGTWVFEVPTSKVGGAELLIENDSSEFDAYDRGLRVDLGLTAGEPAAGAPLTVHDASVRVDR